MTNLWLLQKIKIKGREPQKSKEHVDLHASFSLTGCVKRSVIEMLQNRRKSLAEAQNLFRLPKLGWRECGALFKTNSFTNSVQVSEVLQRHGDERDGLPTERYLGTEKNVIGERVSSQIRRQGTLGSLLLCFWLHVQLAKAKHSSTFIPEIASKNKVRVEPCRYFSTFFEF